MRRSFLDSRSGPTKLAKAGTDAPIFLGFLSRPGQQGVEAYSAKVGIGLRLARPTFADVGKRQIAQVPDNLSVSARSMALTVRLSPSECALVKVRAAEASMSVSAYLRQCALDVDLLREHVEKVLAEFRAASATSNPCALALREVAARPRLSLDWRLWTHRDWLRRGLGVIRLMCGGRRFEGTA